VARFIVCRETGTQRHMTVGPRDQYEALRTSQTL